MVKIFPLLFLNLTNPAIFGRAGVPVRYPSCTHVPTSHRSLYLPPVRQNILPIPPRREERGLQSLPYPIRLYRLDPPHSPAT